MPETTMASPAGSVELRRLPTDHDPSLRAWDAADEYVLDELNGSVVGQPGRWLVVNDLFGALAVQLAERQPQSWGDSITSQRGAVANLERNDIEPARVTMVPSTADPVGPIDVAIVKIPRSLALLEDQLHRLRPLLHRDSIVIGAGMVKSIHRSTIALFESIIGPSPTSLAKKKARLIRASVSTEIAPVVQERIETYYLDSGGLDSGDLDSGRPVLELPNVFSRGKLDLGTRVMLDHLPAAVEGDRVVDLGCGNGLLGLHVAERAEHQGVSLGSMTFVDESYLALASAELTAEAWNLDSPLTFLAGDSLDAIEDDSVDLVVNNPPFHIQQSRSDSVALAMFDDAKRVLVGGGRLVVVGNRHLGYHRELRRRFAAVTTLGSTSKFVVLEARR